MDKNKDVLGRMLMDWCQDKLDTDPRYDDGDDSEDWEEDNELDWGYDLEELEWYPHYEPDEDDDPDLGDGEDQDLYDDEVYEAAKEEYVSRYSSEAEAIKNFEDWVLWKHTRRS